MTNTDAMKLAEMIANLAEKNPEYRKVVLETLKEENEDNKVSVKTEKVSIKTATVYLEHNNAGKIILYNYNDKWWYEDITSNGYYGYVDMYATNEDGEYLSDETIATELARQYAEWGIFDSSFFDEEKEYYISEYDNMGIDDIDTVVNYDPDGIPYGHDVTVWTEICKIDVE